MRRSLAGSALVAASTFLLHVLFNKQAFMNYYWLVVGFLASSIAIDEGETHIRAPLRVEGAKEGDRCDRLR